MFSAPSVDFFVKEVCFFPFMLVSSFDLHNSYCISLSQGRTGEYLIEEDIIQYTDNQLITDSHDRVIRAMNREATPGRFGAKKANWLLLPFKNNSSVNGQNVAK